MNQHIRWIVAVGLPILTVFSGVLLLENPASARPALQATPAGTQSVADLLGQETKQKLADAISSSKIDGKAYDWKQYAAWGKELFFEGQVKSPPTGPKPSNPLSAFYNCSQCHNHRREDRLVTSQDPDNRYFWIEEMNKKIPASEPKLWLAPGTTMWGAVNRTSFYNESYEVYHDLKTANGRIMDPKKLEDAVQVCCRYCSVGRFAERWELQSLLAYLWELEIHLGDLDLPAEIEAVVIQTLAKNADGASPRVRKMRDFLRNQMLQRAGESITAAPTKAEKATTGPYPDKLIFDGDAVSGKTLYSMACAKCHGKNKPSEIEGPALVRDLKRFHKILSIGTEQDDQPYMPRYTAQRLSRQQIADIQAFLTADSKGSN